MVNFGKAIVRLRIPIIILSFLLLIPAGLGFVSTRVNYDILSYLPGDIETMKGQDILKDEFSAGAYSMLVVKGMKPSQASDMRKKIEKVDHVDKVIWYDSIIDLSIPMEVLPDEVYEAFNSGDATLMMVIFDDTTGADSTMDAVEDIRKVADKQCFLAGMTGIVTDTKIITETETPVYIAIAGSLTALVLAITMDSFLIPVLFLLSIGMAIIYNLGVSAVFGDISYLTKALAAVLQLGVTMDYSIFLWNSFEENSRKYEGDSKRAMAHAIGGTLSSVVGSSITTVAGFVALMFMSFTLGFDIGFVMARGVVIGVICCVTVLPSLLLTFEKPIKRFSHRPLMPAFDRIGPMVTKHYGAFVALACVLLIPAAFGQFNAKVYYNLDSTLPSYLDSIKANNELEKNFNLGAVHMVLVDSSTTDKDIRMMSDEMKKVDGVKFVLGLDTVEGPLIPSSMINSDMTKSLESDNWKLMVISSEYKTATKEVNSQCGELKSILKKFDRHGMLIGEAPCTKDLIDITAHDFKVVNIVSIGLVFLIIFFVFKSVSLPFILVAVIELAIFINMGIPFYTGTELPFIASIVIGTIQLGATVDYAILMTNRYKRERSSGQNRHDAVTIAAKASARSIVNSGLSFFAATIGVGIFSQVALISSLCILMARGALISMAVVIFILPSMLMLFDGIIIRTSIGFGGRAKHSNDEKGDMSYERA